MTDISRAYVELAHAIEQHNPGYIDGYYGPDEWAVREQRPLADLARDADDLARAVAALEDEERRAFLAAQVRAMQTSIALLQGEAIPYNEEVRRLYDIEPERVPEERFDEAIALLNDLLPGQGEIAPREQAFRAGFDVPLDRLPSLLDAIVEELARRASALWPLPEGESFEVQVVKDEPWGAYNWYLGNYRSRIDINTDLPNNVTGLPDLVAHEAYPGHHTEHAIKEQLLLREQGRGEHSILLINAPECVVSEGIATRALQMVMSEDEVRQWLEDDLVERAGLSGVDVETMLAINQAKREMRAVTGNAALLLHEEGASEKEVVAYLQRYRLAKPEEARKSVQFITHPNFRSYIFTYTVGANLLDQLFARRDRLETFGRLLREPLTPGTLRAWIAE
jgi:hypothetical protein